MPKLCYLIVLHFVIKIALGNADEDGFTHNYSDSNEEFTTTVTDKNVEFEDDLTTPNIEDKLLHFLEDSLNEVTEHKKLNSLSAVQNDTETFIHSTVNKKNAYPRNCREATKRTRRSGIYSIQVKKYGPRPFEVYCEEDFADGGWTVIAKRMDGSVNFADRNWTEYKEGFGNLSGEFFIGMDKLYALTNGPQKQELLFVLIDYRYNQQFEKYSAFAIGDESEEYYIKTLGEYSYLKTFAYSFSILRDQTFITNKRSKKVYLRFIGKLWYTDDLCCLRTLNYPAERRYSGVIHYNARRNPSLFTSMQIMIRPRTIADDRSSVFV